MLETQTAEIMAETMGEKRAGVNRNTIDNRKRDLNESQENNQIPKSWIRKKEEGGFASGNSVDERTGNQGVELVGAGHDQNQKRDAKNSAPKRTGQIKDTNKIRFFLHNFI